MPDFHSFLQPLVAGRLQVSHRRPMPTSANDPAAGITLVWAERVVVRTASHAFRITVPIDGRLPGQASIDRVLDAVRDLCESAPSAAHGCAITSVDGHARPLRGLRSCLVLTVACAGPGTDCHREAAQVAGLVRNAARRCR